MEELAEAVPLGVKRKGQIGTRSKTESTSECSQQGGLVKGIPRKEEEEKARKNYGSVYIYIYWNNIYKILYINLYI